MARTRTVANALPTSCVVAIAVLAGCAGPPADLPQSHVGTCSHFNSGAHRLENVPNCLLRRRDTLINGLPPIDTDQQP